MPISQRRHGQDKTVLSCFVRVGAVNTTGDMTRLFCLVSTQFQWLLSCLDPVSNSQLFGLKYVMDYWKQSWLVANSVLSCLVLVSGVK